MYFGLSPFHMFWTNKITQFSLIKGSTTWSCFDLRSPVAMISRLLVGGPTRAVPHGFPQTILVGKMLMMMKMMMVMMMKMVMLMMMMMMMVMLMMMMMMMMMMMVIMMMVIMMMMVMMMMMMMKMVVMMMMMNCEWCLNTETAPRLVGSGKHGGSCRTSKIPISIDPRVIQLDWKLSWNYMEL